MIPDFRESVSSAADSLALLRLLHLADSALPIGSLAHSFGLEALTTAEILCVRDLPDFLRGYLQEAGLVEAVACREAFRLLDVEQRSIDVARWLEINEFLGAVKPARESRAASATLGRNFLQLAASVHDDAALRQAGQASQKRNEPVHQSCAFGLTGAVLGLDEDRVVAAFLHQACACLVSACQRLLPLGQNEATRILWNLKPHIVATVERGRELELEAVPCTMPLLDWAAMAHPGLATRLFVS